MGEVNDEDGRSGRGFFDTGVFCLQSMGYFWLDVRDVARCLFDGSSLATDEDSHR